VKHGPVTLLSVVESAGRLKLLTAHAESVPGPILEIGNTNSRSVQHWRAPILQRLERPGPGASLRHRNWTHRKQN
jgi:hypothetical protein